MRRIQICVLLSALLAAPLAAGVVYEIETTDHGQSPPKTESSEMVAEGRNLAMSIAAGPSGRKGRAIFNGERQEMYVVDDADKSYIAIDQATIDQISGMLAGVNEQMAAALESVPQDQRAEIERMMKQRMPSQMPKPPTFEVRRTGETGTQAGYPCVKYVVTRGGQVARELWVTDWTNVEGGENVVDAFRAMAEFMSRILDSLPAGGAAGGMGDSFIAQMQEIDGFPVVTREFGDDGELEDESTLRSATRRTLDPADFEPPSGYKRRSMMGAQ